MSDRDLVGRCGMYCGSCPVYRASHEFPCESLARFYDKDMRRQGEAEKNARRVINHRAHGELLTTEGTVGTEAFFNAKGGSAPSQTPSCSYRCTRSYS